MNGVIPTIEKHGGLWCAVVGHREFPDQQGVSPMIVFKSLDRKNVEAFIKHSWLGESRYKEQE